MKKIAITISKFTVVLLLMSSLQMVFQGIATERVYQFETYTTMGWLFQILYWILSITISIATSFDEEEFL